MRTRHLAGNRSRRAARRADSAVADLSPAAGCCPRYVASGAVRLCVRRALRSCPRHPAGCRAACSIAARPRVCATKRSDGRTPASDISGRLSTVGLLAPPSLAGLRQSHEDRCQGKDSRSQGQLDRRRQPQQRAVGRTRQPGLHEPPVDEAHEADSAEEHNLHEQVRPYGVVQRSETALR